MAPFMLLFVDTDVISSKGFWLLHKIFGKTEVTENSNVT